MSKLNFKKIMISLLIIYVLSGNVFALESVVRDSLSENGLSLNSITAGEEITFEVPPNIDWDTVNLAASDERLVLVYTAKNKVYYHLYDLENSELISEGQVNTCEGTARPSYDGIGEADVAMNEYGEFAVVWTIKTESLGDPDYSPGDSELWDYEDQGNIKYHLNELEYGPCVDMYEVSYTDIQNKGTQYDTYDESYSYDVAMKVFEDDGSVLPFISTDVDGEFLVNNHLEITGDKKLSNNYYYGAYDATSPSVGFYKDNIVVGWADNKKNNEDSGVYAKLFQFDGNEVSPITIGQIYDGELGAIDNEIPLFTNSDNAHKNVEIVAGEIEDTEIFAAAWQTESDNEYKPMTRVFDMEGNAITSSLNMFSDDKTMENVVFPKVALSGSNDQYNQVVVFWHSNSREEIKSSVITFQGKDGSLIESTEREIIVASEDENLEGNCRYVIDAASGLCEDSIIGILSYDGARCRDLISDLSEGVEVYENYLQYYLTKESISSGSAYSIVAVKPYPAVATDNNGAQFYSYGYEDSGEINDGCTDQPGVNAGNDDGTDDGNDDGTDDGYQVFICDKVNGIDSNGDRIPESFEDCWKENEIETGVEWTCTKENKNPLLPAPELGFMKKAFNKVRNFF